VAAVVAAAVVGGTRVGSGVAVAAGVHALATSTRTTR
jgi:hypothetical protein